jgi:hypothetical protein
MTAIGRKTTARVQVGDKLFAEIRGNAIHPTTKKRDGVTVVTVVTVESIAVHSGRRMTTMRVLHTDYGTTIPCTPSQTWGVA